MAEKQSSLQNHAIFRRQWHISCDERGLAAHPRSKV